jgi:hypothetical protein
MSFFDGVPSAEPVPPWSQRPWDPPEAGFPGVVPFRTLALARTEQAAVAITGLSAYAAGFEIYVTARFRPGSDTGPGGPVPGGPPRPDRARQRPPGPADHVTRSAG